MVTGTGCYVVRCKEQKTGNPADSPQGTKYLKYMVAIPGIQWEALKTIRYTPCLDGGAGLTNNQQQELQLRKNDMMCTCASGNQGAECRGKGQHGRSYVHGGYLIYPFNFLQKKNNNTIL